MTSTSTTAKRRFSFRRKAASPLADGHHKKTFWQRVYRDRYLLLLFLPCLIYYILFKYVPMWGVLISFKDFKPFIGFMDSDWVGLKHYVNFFSNPGCLAHHPQHAASGRVFPCMVFPVPHYLCSGAERGHPYPVQKVCPNHQLYAAFLSAVVVCGMLVSFLSPIRGIINTVINLFGGESVNFLSNPAYFRTIYVASEVWQTLGWGAIVYLAAISNVDPQYYEAAKLDGASRLRQIWSITLPCIAPTVATMLILRVGSILEVGLEKVLLLYSPAIYETSDIIATYVYRQGMVSGNMSYASAIGLFSSIINLVLLVTANYFSKKFSDTGLF